MISLTKCQDPKLRGHCNSPKKITPSPFCSPKIYSSHMFQRNYLKCSWNLSLSLHETVVPLLFILYSLGSLYKLSFLPRMLYPLYCGFYLSGSLNCYSFIYLGFCKWCSGAWGAPMMILRLGESPRLWCCWHCVPGDYLGHSRSAWATMCARNKTRIICIHGMCLNPCFISPDSSYLIWKCPLALNTLISLAICLEAHSSSWYFLIYQFISSLPCFPWIKSISYQKLSGWENDPKD